MNNDNDLIFNQSSNGFHQPHFPDPMSEDDTPQLLSEPRRVNAGMGGRWIAHAWEIFKARWAMWMGMAFVMTLITGVIGEIPYIGWIANLLNLFFLGGLMLSCDALVEGDELEFSYLFAGFKYKFSELLFCNIIIFALVMALILGLLLFVKMGFDSETLLAMSVDSLSSEEMMQLSILALLFFVLFIPIIMMMWFAPALICLHDIKPWQAIKMSLQACLRNIKPFIVYSLVIFLLMVGVGLLMLGVIYVTTLLLNEIIGMIVGFVALMPLIFAVTMLLTFTYYTSYRSIWTTPTLED